MPPSGNTSFGIGCYRRIQIRNLVIRAGAPTMVALAAALPAAAASVEASAVLAVAAASAAAVAAEDGSSLSATASYPQWSGRMRFSSGVPEARYLL